MVLLPKQHAALIQVDVGNFQLRESAIITEHQLLAYMVSDCSEALFMHLFFLGA